MAYWYFGPGPGDGSTRDLSYVSVTVCERAYCRERTNDGVLHEERTWMVPGMLIQRMLG